MTQEIEQRVRFIRASRHEDWKKGDFGTIEKVLVQRPENQNNVYIIRADNGSVVWATDEDVEMWYQLSLFD